MPTTGTKDYLWSIAKSQLAEKWLKKDHAHVWTIASNHEKALKPAFAVCCALCGYIDSYLVTTKKPPDGFGQGFAL